MTFQKLLVDIFCVTILSFSNITLKVTPPTSKMVGGITYILFNVCLTAQQIKQFIVTIKTMVYFPIFFSGEVSEFISNIYAFTNLTPRVTTPSAPYLSFNRMQLRSHHVIFYFSSTSVRYHRGRWESLLSFFITVWKRK